MEEGVSARPPTLMKIFSAESTSSPTRTSRGDSKRAWPARSVTLSRPRSHSSLPRRASPEIWSLRALTFFMSTDTAPPRVTPNSDARCAARATAALATSVFVGMQPVLTQVPPTFPRSTMATFMPAPASRAAREGPAWPVPMTIAS